MKDINIYNDRNFYLGANTPSGFVSYFNEVGSYKKDWYRFLIKGGPGTGKSSMMKFIAQELKKNSIDVELIYCSSAPESLDGVILNNEKILVVDATPPHFLEPQFPGVFDKIISVYESFNYEKLHNNRFKVADLFEENLFYQQQAVYLMSAAYGLLFNNIKMVGKYINEEKLNCYINNLLAQDLNLEKRDNNLAGEELRFLTVITQGEQLSYVNTVRSIADKVYVLNDDFGVVSGRILKKVRDHLLNANFNIITCNCSMFSGKKIDHILVPDLKLAFVTSNEHHDFSNLIDCSTTYCEEFVNRFSRSVKEQVNLNNKRIKDIIFNSKKFIAQAQIVHNRLEEYYVDAVDFNYVKDEAEKNIAQIRNLI